MLDSRRRALVISGGMAFIAAACGGGDDKDDKPAAQQPAANPSCKASGIGNNHGHELVIPYADTASAASLSYSIRGSSDHDHTVILSAQQLAQVRSGASVTVNSTTSGGHTHSVTVMCA
jgi:hypothetical protein